MQCHIRPEVFSLTRACACLISQDLPLSDDERSLLEYYMEELSREFFQICLPFGYASLNGQRPKVD
jgi:hypothetical protein